MGFQNFIPMGGAPAPAGPAMGQMPLNAGPAQNAFAGASNAGPASPPPMSGPVSPMSPGLPAPGPSPQMGGMARPAAPGFGMGRNVFQPHSGRMV